MNVLESLPIPNEAQSFALLVALGGVTVSALIVGLARLMRRRSEALRYGILLAGVMGLLAVPALVGVGLGCRDTLPWFAVQPEEEIVRVPAAMLPDLLNRRDGDAPSDDPPSPAAALVGALLLLVWIAGTAIGVGRLLRALCKQCRALAGSPWIAGFWTDERKCELARRLGLKRFPAVHSSPAVPMPMVIGIWCPTIVVPEPAPAAWEQSQWEAVLLHEAAHIARGDPWAVLAQRSAVVLFWWCPLVYLLARRLDALRENICDDWAVQGSCDPIAYAALLVDSADYFLRLQSMPLPLGLIDSARGGLEARVTRLLEKEKPTMTRLSWSGKLLGAACLVAVCLMTTAGTALSGGQSPPAKKIQIKIIIDGKEIDLSDAQLWQHIEAAKQKAAAQADVAQLQALHAQALKALADLKAAQFTAPADPAKGIAFSPDGKSLAIGADRTVRVWDTTTTKVTAQVDQSKSMADPRIEALVKQAEAIKPGSGEQIRRALQAAPKSNEFKFKFDANKPASGLRIERSSDQGKKVIVLPLDAAHEEHLGKLLQLNEADLKKLLEKAGQLRIELDWSQEKGDKAPAVKVKVHADKLAGQAQAQAQAHAADVLKLILKDGKAAEAGGRVAEQDHHRQERSQIAVTGGDACRQRLASIEPPSRTAHRRTQRPP
jgi:beta-lactamase regulating signal transducer with metallopeptidase domain